MMLAGVSIPVRRVLELLDGVGREMWDVEHVDDVGRQLP
jgi:hypothetical protein